MYVNDIEAHRLKDFHMVARTEMLVKVNSTLDSLHDPVGDDARLQASRMAARVFDYEIDSHDFNQSLTVLMNYIHDIVVEDSPNELFARKGEA